MSENGEFVRVGKVKDAHGIKGEIFILLFSGEAAWIDDLNELRLVAENSTEVKIFSIKSVRLHKNGLIAKTGELKDRNEAELLKGWLFEIPSSLFVSKKGEPIYLREIQGFEVVTTERGPVGTIIGFGSNTVQDLLVIKSGENEYEVPFVEAFVQKIDYDKRSLYLDLPSGLLGDSTEDDEQ